MKRHNEIYDGVRQSVLRMRAGEELHIGGVEALHVKTIRHYVAEARKAHPELSYKTRCEAISKLLHVYCDAKED